MARAAAVRVYVCTNPVCEQYQHVESVRPRRIGRFLEYPRLVCVCGIECFVQDIPISIESVPGDGGGIRLLVSADLDAVEELVRKEIAANSERLAEALSKTAR